MQQKEEAVELCPECGFVEGTEPDSPLFLPPRTVLENKYLVGKVLGQGGFGITYLAWDLNLNVKLAIKEYFPQDLASRAAGHSEVSAYSGSMGSQYEYGLDKFLQEARTLAQFEGHPNIVSVRDFFKANGTAYFVMSYVEGVTVKEYLASSGGKLPTAKARGIIMPVLDALKEVHEVNILHRDISPDNIFINQKGQVILIDFGAARQAASEKGHSLSIILKPGYAPEEQYRSKGVQGPWTDIYAVGATFYHLLTGSAPPEALERMVEDGLVAPRQAGADLSEEEEKALLTALAVKADDRFKNVEEFQNALAGEDVVVSAIQPTLPAEVKDEKPAESAEKKKLPLPAIIAAAAAVVLVAAGGLLWAGGIFGGDPAPPQADPGPVEQQVPVETDQPPVTEEPAVVNDTGNSPGNIANGGIAALQGDQIFFRGNEGGALTVATLGADDARLISSDAAWFINVRGDWVYYSNRDDNNRLYRIRRNGSERSPLTDGPAWFVTVVEDRIYYISEQDDYNIYRINTDGTDRIRIGDDPAWHMNLDQQWIYYINQAEEGRMYRISLDGGSREELTAYPVGHILVDGDLVFHTNEDDGGRLYLGTTDGSDTEALTDYPAWFINIDGDAIYYINEDDNFSLNKVNKDGSGRVKLTNDSARYTNLVGGWVFFLDYAEEDSTYKVRPDGTGQSLAESGL